MLAVCHLVPAFFSEFLLIFLLLKEALVLPLSTLYVRLAGHLTLGNFLEFLFGCLNFLLNRLEL